MDIDDGLVDELYILENGNYFEGDIYGVTLSSTAEITKSVNGDLWKFGRIPYVMSAKFTFHQRNKIYSAINELESHSCITFHPRNEEKDYIYFLADKEAGCFSSVGKIGNGPQILNIGKVFPQFYF